MKSEITKGEWRRRVDTAHVECNNEIITIGGFLRVYDDTQLNGESWLEMRDRTQQDRDDIQNESIANANLIADAGTTANKCGLLPSELLLQRDELLEALEEVLPMLLDTHDSAIKAKEAINKSLGL